MGVQAVIPCDFMTKEAKEEAAMPVFRDKMTQTIPKVKEEMEEPAFNHQLVKSTIISSIIWDTNSSAPPINFCKPAVRQVMTNCLCRSTLILTAG